MPTAKTLLYLFTTSFEHPGLATKAKGQAEAFSKTFKVSLQDFHYSSQDSALIKAIKGCLFSITGKWKSILSNTVYCRYNPKFFFLTLWLGFLSSFKPVFLEHNIDLSIELAFLNRQFELKLHHILIGILRFFPIKHVVVTKEIGRTLEKKGIHPSTIIFCQNGYALPDISASDCNEAALQTLKAFKDSSKKLGIFTGNGYRWHGLEEVIDLISAYPEIQLVVVGPYPEKPHESILWLGKHNQATVLSLYAECDFGIGSFRYDMIGLTEASPLKTREYLFQGLPVLINYYDCAQDIPELKPYIFPPDQIQKMLDTHIDKDKIKKTAQQHLSWEQVSRGLFNPG